MNETAAEEPAGTEADQEPSTNTSDLADGETPDPASGTEPTDVGRLRKEAGRYRKQLREAEVERDQLRDQLAAQRREIINWRASTMPDGRVDPALLDAAQIDVEQLVDPGSGHLNMQAVDDFIVGTAKKFNVVRGFTPNRAQSHGGMGDMREPASLADAFKKRK